MSLSNHLVKSIGKLIPRKDCHFNRRQECNKAMESDSNGRNATFGKQCQRYLPLVCEATIKAYSFCVFYKTIPDHIHECMTRSLVSFWF